MDVKKFMEQIKRRNPGQPAFHQAVHEFASDILPYMRNKPQYKHKALLERMTMPDRIIAFRVTWEDDHGKYHVNTGYRVQFNNSIGPYKGGLRFHPSVTPGILKFLAFEQTFKNALTTLPLGGAKGGSDFDPKGKSDSEVMRFCHSFMLELQHHIGKDIDIPAGDIGVGAREISYLFGQYKRIKNEFTGTLTGKGLTFGGSPIRMEATGFGAVYFAEEMLKTRDEGLKGKICTVSGAGNVAQHAIEKLIEMEAKVVSVSDSSGTVYDSDGITKEKLKFIMNLKNIKRGRIEQYAKKYKCKYLRGKNPWHIPCDAAFPCATQNEISEDDAKALLHNKCRMVVEGANMPATARAAKLFRQKKILFAPGKAANAGGVAISGLEMTQNAMRLTWTREQVDEKLHEIMKNIHDQCAEHGKFVKGKHYIDYVKGANIAGFEKVSQTMLAYGAV